MMFPYSPANSKLLLTNYTDATLTATRVGTLAPDGSVYVTILPDETVSTGIYAANGSINVVEGAGTGVYSPCGALNVFIPV